MLWATEHARFVRIWRLPFSCTIIRPGTDLGRTAHPDKKKMKHRFYLIVLPVIRSWSAFRKSWEWSEGWDWRNCLKSSSFSDQQQPNLELPGRRHSAVNNLGWNARRSRAAKEHPKLSASTDSPASATPGSVRICRSSGSIWAGIWRVPRACRWTRQGLMIHLPARAL